jgi:hypothetical protein
MLAKGLPWGGKARYGLAPLFLADPERSTRF